MTTGFLLAGLAVAGFDRFYSDGANPVEGGLLLLGELGCVNCHATRAGLAARPAPVLTGAGSRLRAVPDLLVAHTPRFPGLTADQRKTLATLVLSSESPLPPVPAGSAQRGRELYDHTGCVACHSAANTPDGSTYRPGGLASFLLNPLPTHSRLALQPQQAADIEAHLRRGTPPPPVPAAPAQAARRLFTTVGCSQCHQLERLTGRSNAPAMESLATRLDGGCLNPSTRDTPRFDLPPQQRAAVQAAIRALANGHRVTDRQHLELRLTALNCYACHARNGRGGPVKAAIDSFTVREDTDLGDEGRFPPPLTSSGYKLTPEALRDAIQGRTEVHPQMATRMPDFGPAAAEQLARLLSVVDMPAGFQPIERIGRNTFGRDLVGIKGLGCINCHNLRGRKSLGIGASDLALAPQRLRVEWFRDFLIDPSRFHPGTRMPSFWPGGKATQRAVLAGNAARQIDSLWVYLMEIDQTRLPAGMEERGAYELKPTGSAIVLRAFMKDAGTHAVAVGFPEQVHAAFDSNQVRWALLWRGRFVDAESVWEDRFNPPMVPLGTDIVALPQRTGPAPTFRGYRLLERGVPAFLYDHDGAHVIDSLTPLPGGSGFRRTVEIDTPKPITFQVASPVDSRLRIRVINREAVQRNNELVMQLPAGHHILNLEMTW